LLWGKPRHRLRSERDRKDGTVLGPHQVIVIDLPVVPDLSKIGGAAGEAGQAPRPSKPKTRRFPARYESAELTPCKDIEVKPGKQTLDFDIKSGKR
jgi:hypothetical protein